MLSGKAEREHLIFNCLERTNVEASMTEGMYKIRHIGLDESVNTVEG
jgi:hypothetical protein